MIRKLIPILHLHSLGSKLNKNPYVGPARRIEKLKSSLNPTYLKDQKT